MSSILCRRRLALVAAVAAAWLTLSSAIWPWGRRGHEIANQRAIENLPEPLRAYFRSRASYLAEHASDPDLLGQSDPSEKPHHYTDGDAYDH